MMAFECLLCISSSCKNLRAFESGGGEVDIEMQGP